MKLITLIGTGHDSTGNFVITSTYIFNNKKISYIDILNAKNYYTRIKWSFLNIIKIKKSDIKLIKDIPIINKKADLIDIR